MQSRRNFLKSSLALPMMTSAGSLLGTFGGFNAHAVDTTGYRALVCVFLFGGMDCHDTILPFDSSSYNDYSRIRASLLASYGGLPGGSSRAQSSLLALEPATANFGGRQFALPPEMKGMQSLFEQGRAAVVGNVGPLLQPTNRTTFNNGTAKLPARLFSHNDQQSTWMSFQPEGSQLGWGGLFGDAAARGTANADAIFSQISLAGNAVFLTGNAVSPYQIGVSGVPDIRLIKLGGGALGANVRDHFYSTGSNRTKLLERDFINLSQLSLDANDVLERALQSGSRVETPFPQSGLGAQLKAVADTMAVRESLGASRQVFFVGLGGFDTHSAQATDLPALQQDIGDSIAAFYNATEELGIAHDVTTFTMADFGRTLTVNGDGTDHGWGSHHFVVGGSVKGGDIYGDIPPSVLQHDQDAGNGRLIPSVSVEQFAAPLGRWFGLNQAELNTALPGMANFPGGGLEFI